jgi:hypothetical protein
LLVTITPPFGEVKRSNTSRMTAWWGSCVPRQARQPTVEPAV